MSEKKEILEALKTALETIPDINTVEFEQIRVNSNDWQVHELPAIQIYDVGDVPTHMRGRVEKAWALSIELIMRTKEGLAGIETVNQGELLDLEDEIEKKLGENVRLGLNYVRHIQLTGNITDLHFSLPNFIARLDVDILYITDYTGSC